MRIILPLTFTEQHKAAAFKFVQDPRQLTRTEWLSTLACFDLLHSAIVEHREGKETFAHIYQRLIEARFADAYISALYRVTNVAKAAEPLRAQVSRQIRELLRRAELYDPTRAETFYLFAYCLYWWYAFAKGFAFEVEVLRDLAQTGIEFQAHDLRHRRGRLSPFDLVVLGFTGDIKTSTYFLHVARSQTLANDFYITRLTDEHGRYRTLVVFLKPPAWEAIDGETIPATLRTLSTVLPAVAEIEHHDQALVVLEYEEWKTRVSKVQSKEQSDE